VCHSKAAVSTLGLLELKEFTKIHGRWHVIEQGIHVLQDFLEISAENYDTV
jgi:hypothetical protein